MPAAQPNFFVRLYRSLLDADQRAMLRHEAEFARYKAELRVLSISKSRCRSEAVTSQLALGTCRARIAPDKGQAILDAYKTALSFNRTDMDALELAAKQAYALKLLPQARQYLDDLVDAASGRNPIRRARALRFHAEILHGGQRVDREFAREKLVAAIAALNNADAREPSIRDYELGMANELLAAVQITRERFSAARTALNSAKLHFRNSSTALGNDGSARLLGLEERLTKAEKDKDNPEVSD
jgi:hypothetical protein